MEETKHHSVFICIEGIDGSGKTTQAHRLVKTLTKKGYDAVYTTEPSKGTYGKIIRKHILQGNNRVPTVVEAVLFAADRVDHVENEVKPLLKAGKTVVCDRYVYSSIAYQGAVNLNQEWIRELNKHAVKPDLAVYIDVLPKIVINRIKRRKSVMETLQTQENVRKLYLKLVEEKQLVMVDGNVSIKEVAEAIENMVLKFLEKH
ncbi:MAG: dTMP kinase [Candidatus Bathyarchaeota archaeon]|nr:dTMP kinase [Candidatus Bathyarchaeota archaeon]MDH5495251.1 dTMP kinase [Candidatus Bathyarchaeota archaeon]